MALAEQAVHDHETLVDWDEYDLDNDGYVDRLLILHSTNQLNQLRRAQPLTKVLLQVK